MKPFKGTAEEITSVEKLRGYKTEVESRTERKERSTIRNEVMSEEHLEIYGGGLSDGGRMKKTSHGSTDEQS